jgi:hypothetical protein
MRPKGVSKRSHEYDHARGCPNANKRMVNALPWGRIEDLCNAAQLNLCPNDPPCDQDEPLRHDEWCGVCLLVSDLRKLMKERTPHPLPDATMQSESEGPEKK